MLNTKSMEFSLYCLSSSVTEHCVFEVPHLLVTLRYSFTDYALWQTMYARYLINIAFNLIGINKLVAAIRVFIMLLR